MDAAQAGRWARGLTLMHNRDAERVTLETEPIDSWTYSYVVYDFVDAAGINPTVKVAALLSGKATANGKEVAA